MYNEAPIIVNEEALTEAFVPTRLLQREGQIRELERCLTPALDNRSIENIFLIGTSGTGKTTIAKWALENYFKEISAYVNCWKHRTTFEALKEILLRFASTCSWKGANERAFITCPLSLDSGQRSIKNVK